MDVLAQWSLRDAAVEVVDSGATNQTWRVVDGDRVWFLRRSRHGDRRVAQQEHDLISLVADAAVATPRPIPADNDETIVDFDGEVFSLFESAEGQQLEPHDLSVDHAASAGAFLGRLHTATADVPVGGFQVVHGDYQHANLFFAGTDVAAVIDWDTAAVTTRGFEVVRACSFMFGLDPARTNSFLSGYRKCSPLSAAELSDGARAWGCYSDHHVWPLEETYRNGNRAAARFIPRQPFVPFARAWESLELS